MPPNLIPGSRPARDKGCRCPVANNNNGERCPFPPDGWITTQDCPVHGPPEPPMFAPPSLERDRRRRAERSRRRRGG